MLASLLGLLMPAAAGAASAEASAPPSQAATTAEAQADATLQVFNRDIITFRSAALGVSAPDRARRAKQRIRELLTTPGAHQVSLSSNPLGMLVQIDGATALIVTTDDADKLQQETVEIAARRLKPTCARWPSRWPPPPCCWPCCGPCGEPVWRSSAGGCA
jgi:hypothetical protein